MPEPDTIADGLLTNLGEWTWPLIQHYVDHIFTVPDHAIVEAMRLLWGRMKQVVEPSGAVALAVALSHAFKARHAGERIGLVLSGGNVDLGFLARDKQS
jgi:threonine dehydratase